MRPFEAYSLYGAGNRLRDAVEFSSDPMAAALVASVILFAAIPTPTPVRVMLKDLVGMWVTVASDCSRGATAAEVSISSARTESTRSGALIAFQRASGF